MKNITPPIQRNSQGNEVKNLHYILFFLTQKMNNVEINNFFTNTGFQEVYTKEVYDQKYGKDTDKFVNIFQEQFQLQHYQSGSVDEPTAKFFNDMLKEYGGLNIDKPDKYPYIVSDDTVVPEIGRAHV